MYSVRGKASEPTYALSGQWNRSMEVFSGQQDLAVTDSLSDSVPGRLLRKQTH